MSPLRRRSNGSRSVTMVLDAGRSCSFRYLADGRFFDDADARSPNGFGATHSIIVP